MAGTFVPRSISNEVIAGDALILAAPEGVEGFSVERAEDLGDVVPLSSVARAMGCGSPVAVMASLTGGMTNARR